MCIPSALKLPLPAIPWPPLTRVRVSGGHLCEAEAPTEAAAEKLAKPQVLTEGEKKANSRNNLLSVIKITTYHIYRLKSKIRNAVLTLIKN